MLRLTSSSRISRILFNILFFWGFIIYISGFCISTVVHLFNEDLYMRIILILIDITISIFAYGFLSVIHENSHAVVGLRYGIKSEISYFSKGWFTPYCKFDSQHQIKKHEFIKIALAPFIVIVCIFVVIFVLFYFLVPLFYECYVIGLFLIKAAGCLGDLKLFIDATKLPSDKKLVQSEESGEFFIV